jgi:hypothetical protein
MHAIEENIGNPKHRKNLLGRVNNLLAEKPVLPCSGGEETPIHLKQKIILLILI